MKVQYQIIRRIVLCNQWIPMRWNPRFNVRATKRDVRRVASQGAKFKKVDLAQSGSEEPRTVAVGGVGAKCRA